MRRACPDGRALFFCGWPNLIPCAVLYSMRPSPDAHTFHLADCREHFPHDVVLPRSEELPASSCGAHCAAHSIFVNFVSTVDQRRSVPTQNVRPIRIEDVA